MPAGLLAGCKPVQEEGHAALAGKQLSEKAFSGDNMPTWK